WVTSLWTRGDQAARPRGRSRTAGRPGRLDIARDLRHELRLALERRLVTQPLPELDDHAPPVEVALVVEQERLDAPLVAAVVRVDADRDRRPVVECGARVDPEAGHDEGALDPEIRRRETERAAAGVARDDDPFDLDGPSEQRRRLAHLAGADQLADPRRR